jgi:hypothetical protein
MLFPDLFLFRLSLLNDFSFVPLASAVASLRNAGGGDGGSEAGLPPSLLSELFRLEKHDEKYKTTEAGTEKNMTKH